MLCALSRRPFYPITVRTSTVKGHFVVTEKCFITYVSTAVLMGDNATTVAGSRQAVGEGLWRNLWASLGEALCVCNHVCSDPLL